MADNSVLGIEQVTAVVVDGMGFVLFACAYDTAGLGQGIWCCRPGLQGFCMD